MAVILAKVYGPAPGPDEVVYRDDPRVRKHCEIDVPVDMTVPKSERSITVALRFDSEVTLVIKDSNDDLVTTAGVVFHNSGQPGDVGMFSQ